VGSANIDDEKAPRSKIKVAPTRCGALRGGQAADSVYVDIRSLHYLPKPLMATLQLRGRRLERVVDSQAAVVLRQKVATAACANNSVFGLLYCMPIPGAPRHYRKPCRYTNPRAFQLRGAHRNR